MLTEEAGYRSRTPAGNRRESSAGERRSPDGRIEEERPDVFRQVILYVLDRVGGKPNVLGEAVLHNLFYFICPDFDYYEKNSKRT